MSSYDEAILATPGLISYWPLDDLVKPRLTNLCTNPKAGSLATTNWTPDGLTTFAAVTFPFGSVIAPPIDGVTTGLHCATSTTLKSCRFSAPDVSCDVGIFDSAGAKIVTSGSTASKLNSTGVKTVTIASTRVKAGRVYYVAFSNDTSSTDGRMVSFSFASAQIADLWGDGVGALGTSETGSMNTAFPLPTTLTLASASQGITLMLRGS